MKTYSARTIRNRVIVIDDADRTRTLKHHVHHSPDGHAWGYHGSGPAELAKDILWDVLGHAPAPWLYQRFKSDVIASFPMDDPFVLSEGTINDWLTRVAREESMQQHPAGSGS